MIPVLECVERAPDFHTVSRKSAILKLSIRYPDNVGQRFAEGNGFHTGFYAKGSALCCSVRKAVAVSNLFSMK